MVLKLGLPTGKVVWALAHPVSREYIHDQSGVGYQAQQLIVTETAQPVEIELDDYPRWAQAQIVTSIHRGELINTGESHIRKKKSQEKKEAKDDVVITTEVAKPKTTKKKAAKRRNTKSKNE